MPHATLASVSADDKGVKEARLNQASILYVDDQRSHQLLFRKAFPDYQVLIASSGKEGLSLLEENEIFLVIADNQMPKMSGVDFLTHVKDSFPHITRAILSAYYSPSLVSEAVERAKISEYLHKPWRRDQIRPFIEKVWQHYQESFEPTHSEKTDRFLSPPPFKWEQLTEVLDHLGNSTDRRGSKRVRLTYVEPSIRPIVATIHRPVPEALRLAEEGAIKGDMATMEKYLALYLSETSDEKFSLKH